MRIHRLALLAESLGGAVAAEYAEDRSDPTGHIGAGIRADPGRVGASLEMSNCTSVVRAASEPGPGDVPVLSKERQHDLVYSLGLRLRGF